MECTGITRVVRVLIETYWNVKWSVARSFSDRGLSINRNILECKGGKCIGCRLDYSRINRNILECKG